MFCYKCVLRVNFESTYSAGIEKREVGKLIEIVNRGQFYSAIALNLRRPGRSNRASHARFYPSAHNFITRIEEEERVGFFGGRRISNNFITISMASQ